MLFGSDDDSFALALLVLELCRLDPLRGPLEAEPGGGGRGCVVEEASRELWAVEGRLGRVAEEVALEGRSSWSNSIPFSPIEKWKIIIIIMTNLQ